MNRLTQFVLVILSLVLLCGCVEKGVSSNEETASAYSDRISYVPNDMAVRDTVKGEIDTYYRPEIGDGAVVGGWRWVDVMNEHPISQEYANATHDLTAGDTCGIEVGGALTVLGVDNPTRRVLVEYEAPGPQLGTPCPSGVIFFMSWEQFAMETNRFVDVRKKEDDERKLVSDLLKRSRR